MGCRVYNDSELLSMSEKTNKEHICTIEKMGRVLCGAFTLLTKKNIKFLDQLDYQEMDVSKDWVANWWKEHQEKDNQRKLKEKQSKLNEQRRIDRLNRLKDLKQNLSAEDIAIIKEFGL